MDDTVRHSAFDIQYSIFKTRTFFALIDLDPDIDPERFRDCQIPNSKINESPLYAERFFDVERGWG